MTRRSLLKSIAAVGAWLGNAADQPKRYGPMTVETHRLLCARGIHLHVFYRGQDVTDRCRYADDTDIGFAELFLLDQDGRKFLVRDHQFGHANDQAPFRHAAMETVYGVTFQEGEPFA